MWDIRKYGYLSDYLWWWILLSSLLVHTWCLFRFCPRHRRRARLVLGNLLISLCGLLAIGTAGETYLRFFSVQTDPYGAGPSRRWAARYVETNLLGFRDHDWLLVKPAGMRRIAFVGDSFTMGWGIEKVEDRFTAILARQFRDRGQSVEVMTVAKGGWETGDELEALGSITRGFSLDEVVLCYCINDIDDLLPRTADQPEVFPPDTPWINVESSYLIESLYLRIVVSRLPGVHDYFERIAEGYNDPTSWEIQQIRMGMLIDLCRERGVKVRVVLLPMVRVGSQRYNAQHIHQKLADFLSSKEVEVLDLLPVLSGYSPEMLVVNAADYHPNELAHRLFAEGIWEGFFKMQ